MSEAYRYQTAEKHVMDMIASGALKAGDRLPSLRRLGMRLKLSLSTVSQAYMELEARGIIEARPRSGFFVRSAGPRLSSPEKRATAVPGPAEVSKNGLIRMVLDHNLGSRDIVPLGLAIPSLEILPMAGLSRAMSWVMREQAARTGCYEETLGSLELRQEIARLAAEAGAPVDPADVLVTGGTVEALCLAFRAVTRPGDAVLIQTPIYYCLLQLIETLGLRAVEIPSDPVAGVSPDDVAGALRKYPIRACAIIASFNNPDGSRTAEEARREIVRLLAERDIPLIEDDIYGDLHFGPERPRPCRAFDSKGQVMLCSSFSKTLAPGYRVGWIMPGRFRDKILELKTTTNVCSPSPTQLAVARHLRSGVYERDLRRLRAALARQMRELHLAIGREFPPGTKATYPRGGVVLWVRLPEGVDGVEYFLAASREGISVAPGAIFSPRDCYDSYVRLSFGYPWSERIESAVRTLGRLARDMAG